MSLNSPVSLTLLVKCIREHMDYTKAFLLNEDVGFIFCDLLNLWADLDKKTERTQISAGTTTAKFLTSKFLHYYLWMFNHWLYSENKLDKHPSWPSSVIGPSNISATTQQKHEAQFLWQSKLSSTVWDWMLWSWGLWVLWEKISPPMLYIKAAVK